MTGEVYVCRGCKKLFRSLFQTSYCEKCTVNNKEFDDIARYLEKHPRSNAIVVSQNTQIPIPRIVSYINEGRLVVIQNNELELPQK